MRRSAVGSVIGFILFLALLGFGGWAVWNAGYNQGLIEAAETTTEVVVRGPYYPGFGFGIFGILFAFLLFGFIFKLFFARRYWRRGPGAWSHDDYRNRMEQRMTEWHDEAHGRTPRPDTPRE